MLAAQSAEFSGIYSMLLSDSHNVWLEDTGRRGYCGGGERREVIGGRVYAVLLRVIARKSGSWQNESQGGMRCIFPECTGKENFWRGTTRAPSEE